jgi:hypothetical protein
VGDREGWSCGGGGHSGCFYYIGRECRQSRQGYGKRLGEHRGTNCPD